MGSGILYTPDTMDLDWFEPHYSKKTFNVRLESVYTNNKVKVF